MTQNTVQLRVTLPIELQGYLQTKANKFGLNMSSYVKNLILNDVKDIKYPIFQASEKIQKDYDEAKEDEKKGKLIKIDNLEEFLQKL